MEIENKSDQSQFESCVSQVRKLQSKGSVRFSADAVEAHAVVAYSRVYGALPSEIVATSSGRTSVSQRANHYTGKSSMVMEASQKSIRGKTQLWADHEVPAHNDTNRWREAQRQSDAVQTS